MAIDLRLPHAGDADVGRFVVERVDDEPEAVDAVDDGHTSR